ncbi:TPA: sigma-70 family RNA polymerase sigma factor [Clostridium botulinum]|nr:sigma-70 family RNA polymerase sigma factor [Clostridium botulinum]HDK7206443.1 sigma-70 family RNA polymerase sigma factor [Clostridium botulinum]HDK7210179.1 sigma-70 family RNA polymerase sigma factor [Clostridium botulinum]HDK7265628.1 sigma-70 family RNA polymerase sigma factor [Clostridium botulinum]HDK7269476.1 sigma-70 family RNA polymerase sigma factor [Clostridium botulinum]
MKNEEIMERKDLREQLIKNVEVLDKVKNVILLPYGKCMTTNMIADYFEVDVETIKKSIQRNKKELTFNEMKILKKKI